MRTLIFVATGVLVFGVWGACSHKKEMPSEAKNVQGSALQSEESRPFVPPVVKKKQKNYFPEGTPSRAIQDLDDILDSYVLNPKTREEREYNDNLKRHIIHGTFDIRELCRLALDKHWKEINSSEQDEFVDLMIRLLEKKAVFSKEQGQKSGGSKEVYKVTYEGHRFLNPDKTLSLTKSLVHIPSESIKIGLDYKLKKAGEVWKIYDVIVDGASLLDNYKYQFDAIISKEGYPDLVHRMDSRLKELNEKDQNKSP